MKEHTDFKQNIYKMAGKFIYQDGSIRPLHFMPMLEDVLLLTPELTTLTSIKLANTGRLERNDPKVQNMLKYLQGQHGSLGASEAAASIISFLNIQSVIELYPGIGLLWEHIQLFIPEKHSTQYAIFGTNKYHHLCCGLHSLGNAKVDTLNDIHTLNKITESSIFIYNMFSSILYGEEPGITLQDFIQFESEFKLLVMPLFYEEVPVEVTSIRGVMHKAYSTRQFLEMVDDTWSVRFENFSGSNFFLPRKNGFPPQYGICIAFKADGVPIPEKFTPKSAADWPEATQASSGVRYHIINSSNGTLKSVTETSSETQLIRTHTQVKFLFLDEEGESLHEYPIPTNRDLDNLAGYTDKLFKYRDPALAKYLMDCGASAHSLKSAPFHLLQTRSPQLDWILSHLVTRARSAGKKKTRLFELGCTVCEHLDMLDLLLRAGSNNTLTADEALEFDGLDISPQILDTARMLHPDFPSHALRLFCAEGSDLSEVPRHYDITFTVGVLNHIHNPMQTLEEILQRSQTAFLGVVWVTHKDEGFWAVVHSGRHIYFFSLQDFRRIQEKLGGQFSILTYVPETASTQRSSYIGISPEEEEGLGSILIMWTPEPSAIPAEALLLPDTRNFSRQWVSQCVASVYDLTL